MRGVASPLDLHTGNRTPNPVESVVAYRSKKYAILMARDKQEEVQEAKELEREEEGQQAKVDETIQAVECPGYDQRMLLFCTLWTVICAHQGLFQPKRTCG